MHLILYITYVVKAQSITDNSFCLSRTANEKLNEFLQSTRTACGEEDYTTIKTALSRDAFVFVSTFGIPRYPEQCDFQVDETPSSAL